MALLLLLIIIFFFTALTSLTSYWFYRYYKKEERAGDLIYSAVFAFLTLIIIWIGMVAFLSAPS